MRDGELERGRKGERGRGLRVVREHTPPWRAAAGTDAASRGQPSRARLSSPPSSRREAPARSGGCENRCRGTPRCPSRTGSPAGGRSGPGRPAGAPRGTPPARRRWTSWGRRRTSRCAPCARRTIPRVGNPESACLVLFCFVLFFSLDLFCFCLCFVSVLFRVSEIVRRRRRVNARVSRVHTSFPQASLPHV